MGSFKRKNIQIGMDSWEINQLGWFFKESQHPKSRIILSCYNSIISPQQFASYAEIQKSQTATISMMPKKEQPSAGLLLWFEDKDNLIHRQYRYLF